MSWEYKLLNNTVERISTTTGLNAQKQYCYISNANNKGYQTFSFQPQIKAKYPGFQVYEQLV